MPTAEPFIALGAANGFADALTTIAITSDLTLSGSVPLEDAMKAYWNVSRMQFDSTDINLAGGFTFRDPNYSNGNINYPEITPKKRIKGIAAGAGENLRSPDFNNLVESIKSYDDNSSLDVEIFQTNIDHPKYALVDDERKYFHGIKFQYSNASYGSFGSSFRAVVTFDSRPMFSPAGLAAANQNTSSATFGLASENDQDGFISEFKEVTQSLVNIGGLDFVKTIEFNNTLINVGSFPGDVVFITDKNSTSRASSDPSLDFYTYPE